MALSKQQILDAKDLPTEEVPVPEWGGSVRIRTLNGLERDAFEATLIKQSKGGLENVRARLVATCLIDDAGNQMFDSGDVALLGRKSAKALDRVFSRCQALSGFSKEDVDELAKNSGSGPSAASTSSSPSPSA